MRLERKINTIRSINNIDYDVIYSFCNYFVVIEHMLHSFFEFYTSNCFHDTMKDINRNIGKISRAYEEIYRDIDNHEDVQVLISLMSEVEGFFSVNTLCVNGNVVLTASRFYFFAFIFGALYIAYVAATGDKDIYSFMNRLFTNLSLLTPGGHHAYYDDVPFNMLKIQSNIGYDYDYEQVKDMIVYRYERYPEDIYDYKMFASSMLRTVGILMQANVISTGVDIEVADDDGMTISGAHMLVSDGETQYRVYIDAEHLRRIIYFRDEPVLEFIEMAGSLFEKIMYYASFAATKPRKYILGIGKVLSDIVMEG